MKNLLILSVLISLTACSESGSSSPNASPTTPVVNLPDDLSNITISQLYKSDTCFTEQNNNSSRRYLTKTNAESDFTYESDLFQSTNTCELSAPVILMTMRYSYKLVSHENSLTPDFTRVVLRQLALELMIHDQFTLDLYNSQSVLGGNFQLGVYKDISGLAPYYPSNETLSAHEINYSSGIISFDGENYQ